MVPLALKDTLGLRKLGEREYGPVAKTAISLTISMPLAEDLAAQNTVIDPHTRSLRARCHRRREAVADDRDGRVGAMVNQFFNRAARSAAPDFINSEESGLYLCFGVQRLVRWRVRTRFRWTSEQLSAAAGRFLGLEAARSRQQRCGLWSHGSSGAIRAPQPSSMPSSPVG
jgi:hypothetical protein